MARHTVVPWHIQNPRALDEMKSVLREHFPTLWVQVEETVVFLRGALPLKDPLTGLDFDCYQIEVILPTDFPDSVPKVAETDGRIPKIAERHFSPDEIACLFVPEERWRAWPPGADIVSFLVGPVTHFFMGQAHFDLTGEWPFGVRSHGLAGRYEYYCDLLGSRDPRVVTEFVHVLAAGTPRGHWPCYCGSGAPLRKCHLRFVQDMRARIPVRIAKSAYEDIRALLREIHRNTRQRYR